MMNFPEGRPCSLSQGVMVFVLGTDLATADGAGSRDFLPQSHLLVSGTQVFYFQVNRYKLVKSMDADCQERAGTSF